MKLFADTALLEQILEHNTDDITGFTTNPSLMRKAGVENYAEYAKKILGHITNKPVSFEVLADELPEMTRQAREIASWGKNVYVKIPVTNTKGESTAPIISELSNEGIKLNVTAIFTLNQTDEVINALNPETPSVISIFAGRIANAGIDPMPIMAEAVEMCKTAQPKAEVLWASAREAFNVKQAEECGCHIITLPPSLIKATKNFGKDLTQFSLETVEMFYQDAMAADFVV